MEQISLRAPFVAGQFYPASVRELNRLISSFADKSAQKKDCLGVVLPHAGYIYSGRVATQTISRVNIKDTLVLLGPNHTGMGKAFSIMPKGTWQTPLGDLEIDSKLADMFLNKSKHLRIDALAHLEEHSLEVELPILQYFRGNFKIVPIAFKTDELLSLKEVAEELAQVIRENNLEKTVMFIASTDLTHYEAQKIAEKKDALAIKAITELDEDNLDRIVKESNITMCGFAPVTVLIKATKLLGAKKGELIKYQTSGETSGDFSSVVGYAGITIN